jgi:hypothetical protein
MVTYNINYSSLKELKPILHLNKKKMLSALYCRCNVLLITLYSKSHADTLFCKVQEATI